MSARFLAFSYKPRGGSSKTRVALWRALKDLGAVYLQQGVALLPRSAALQANLEALKERVASEGGSAAIASLAFLSRADEEAIVGEFLAARGAEYREVETNCAAFEEEIARTAARGEYNFPELEEAGAEIAKLERWLARVVARDYYGEASRRAAEGALKSARARLASYELEVFARERRAR